MERWGDKAAAAPAPARARRYVDQPSFSSTLLDAIYKSMDEPDGGGVTAAKKQSQDLHYNNSYYYKASLAGSYRATRAPATPGPHATTSSSSDCSSYGGFSSSEAESSHHHRRLRPIRTSVAAASTLEAPAPAPEKTTKKAAKNNNNNPGANIRAKLRELRKAPASPGARLAGFLNSIFNGKRAPPPATTPRAAAESACSTASSYSRSCLSKTPSTRGQPKRTVRFMDTDTGEVERRRVQVGVVELEQMLLHRMEMDSDEDDEDEESSDASSDLFDLENFAAAAAPGGAAAYKDELPVYETTRVVLNRAIGHGYTHGRSTRVV
ncbi:hypothetical protein HU200_003691 [Digitaria exilis]|uniref:Protein BIG GRAIN 1 n=1 Tax=Digitaria exilis TaxID=1010633 RepID=A0A835FUT0_9POAL|nr:hypothetical protein HU200_003691 [Digitaria exilis]